MSMVKIRAAAPALAVWGIPFIISASFCYLAASPDLRTAAPELAGVTALATCLLALALFAGEKGRIAWSPATILAVAALLRLLFVFRAPELSDDIYRYLWDGLRTLAGHNPYALAPAQIQPATAAAAALLGQVNHPELVTIYPPAAQGFFALGAAAGGGVLGMKALLTLLDLFTCAMIIRLLPSFGLSSSRAVLYAWHPLPILEIAGSGHIDGAGIFCLVAALALLAPLRGAPSADGPGWPRTRLFCSGLLFCAASLVKLFPFVFLPGMLLLVRRGERKLFGLGFLAGGLALCAPFRSKLGNGLGTLGIYLHDWEFAGFLFRTLRQALASGAAARFTLAGLFASILMLFYGRLWRLKEIPAQPSAASALPVMRVFLGIALAFLLLTPTLHPWYALYLAALLPFAAGPASLVLSWSVLLSYRVLIHYATLGIWREDDLLPALIWLAPAGALLIFALATALPGRPPRES